MRVKFLGITQETYRATTTVNPIRTLQISRGAIVDLPEERVKKLQRDYPKDWQVLGSDVQEAPQVSEPVAAAVVEENENTKGDDNQWTRKKAGKK